jgi:hypothetical protein
MISGFLRFLIPLVFLIGYAQGQLVSSLRLSKSQYVAGEPVIAIVTITNHSGRDLVLQSQDRVPWLDFLVRNANGSPVTSPKRTTGFGALKIPVGQSMAREIDLSQHFHLSEPGNFSVAAVIRMPGQSSGDTGTNRVIFSLNPGRTYWSQKIGIPERPGQTREYRILNFNGEQKSELYAQVLDNTTGRPVRTFLLGDSLSMRKPTVTIDRAQRLHVLFLATPTMYLHCEVDSDGRLVNRQIHQRGPQGDPTLMTSPKGDVLVSNSIPYDPKAIEEQKKQSRKASDRPAFIYE